MIEGSKYPNNKKSQNPAAIAIVVLPDSIKCRRAVKLLV
jgi:hypothetical protein